MAQVQVGGPPLHADMTDAEYARIVWKSVVPKKYNHVDTSGIEVDIGPDGIQPDIIALVSER